MYLESPSERPDRKQIRVTVPIDVSVHQEFVRMASASGSSVGRCMGEWLEDSVEAIQFMTQKIEEARAAPQKVMRELHAYALGITDKTETLLQSARTKAVNDRTAVRATGRSHAGPGGQKGGDLPR